MVDELVVEMKVEEDDEGELLGALVAEGLNRVLTPKAAREANSIYEMLLVQGVSRGDAAAKVAELYSPPRVTAELGRLPCMSLVGGLHLRPTARRQWGGLGLPEARPPAESSGADQSGAAFPGDWQPSLY